MRLLSVLIVACLVMVISGACELSSDSKFTVQVTGDSGVEFSGNYVTSKYDPVRAVDSESVEGTVPQTYYATGHVINCKFTKKSADDKLLKVQIFKGSTLVSEAQTTEPRGTVRATGT